ncbi:MAG: hypothetical protein ACYYKD_13760 [Rhodospirillales bacterium]
MTTPMTPMTPVIIQDGGFLWQIVYHHQSLLAGLLALIAAAITTAFLWRQSRAIAEEGKHDRAFRMKQHAIEIQTKRHAAAVLLEAEIRSVMMANLVLVVKETEPSAKKSAYADDDETLTFRFFSPVFKLFLNNYSNYTENMPLMRVETVREISLFHIHTAKLSAAIELANARIAGDQNNFTTAVSTASMDLKKQFKKTVPLLVQEMAEAQKELDHLKGVKEKLTASVP